LLNRPLGCFLLTAIWPSAPYAIHSHLRASSEIVGEARGQGVWLA
jgi:hypothetical protein